MLEKSFQGLFCNILSDCHNLDEIKYLLNAFRLDKKTFQVTCLLWLLAKGLTYSHLSNKGDITLTDFGTFHPAQKKSTLHVY